MQQHLERQRRHLLTRLDRSLERPMLVLSFVWVALFVVQLTIGLDPFLRDLGYLIWALFIVEYAVKFAVAPDKLRFLAQRWLSGLALLLPAFGMLRVGPLVRALANPSASYGLQFARMLARTNRGLSAISRSFGSQGMPYVLGMTGVITVVGAAGMSAFEAPLRDYGFSLWWTAMIMTTMGSDYYPHTAAGRLLCLLLSVYAFAVFGYITAAIASFLVKNRSSGATSQQNPSLADVLAEVRALRGELRAVTERAAWSQQPQPHPQQ